ncbi:type III restriction endonuclease subunit M [Mycoplasmopsis caviae]|uniref:C-terminal truncated Type III restriction-modification system: methylase n=1 Tax=Mycoplasmopsis caviae TaxID=55603 RepID=A0A3P8MDK0_9BACT|nr:type III restriction endonuclease subunit M [Mycoplasmopsis caviae]UUD35302.1 type III restriction endonuclease subunit M [Mycoplasmopsis caviae]VDR41920.1 C-terminal truncated Type III restriction-modification system: methylase [Mycoplasmopsis caviae]
MNKNEVLNSFIQTINDWSKNEINDDQKNLIINILKKSDKEDLHNVMQLLLRRIKVGFTFDEALNTNKTTISLLKFDDRKSFVNNENTESPYENTLIIGENYDALKNLLVIENERERERDRLALRAFTI